MVRSGAGLVVRTGAGLVVRSGAGLVVRSGAGLVVRTARGQDHGQSKHQRDGHWGWQTLRQQARWAPDDLALDGPIQTVAIIARRGDILAPAPLEPAPLEPAPPFMVLAAYSFSSAPLFMVLGDTLAPPLEWLGHPGVLEIRNSRSC